MFKAKLQTVILATLVAAMLAAQCTVSAAESASSQVRDGDRIVFVGDSITGQGVNVGVGGFINLLKEGLDMARPGNHVTVVALGGSGQGVGSWLGVEKRSREKASYLDVPKVEIKENLDRHADILVIMLGMNDSLAPYIHPDRASLDGWTKQYRELIVALRARTTPRVTALATVTPNTEDPGSPKNQLIAELNRRLAVIARDESCVLLPCGETVLAVLQKGRTLQPDFHVTTDFVHPNPAGHPALAVGMLKGLGEGAAAEAVAGKYLAKVFASAQGTLPALSYAVTPRAMPLDSDEITLEIRYFWTPGPGATSGPRARLQAPPEWKVIPAEVQGASGTFKATGKLDRLANTFKLQVADGAAKKQAEVIVPAPWLIGSGFLNPEAWENPGQKFAPEKGVLAGEERLAQGHDFGRTPEGWKGEPPKWVKYVASVDFTGGTTPGNVSLYAVSFAATFEGAYGARWIFSEKELPVQVSFGTRTFAGQMAVVAWLNGEKFYAGTINAEPDHKRVRAATLRKGWNSLVFKSNHCTWQWQFSMDLACEHPADLERLRLTTVSPLAK